MQQDLTITLLAILVSSLLLHFFFLLFVLSCTLHGSTTHGHPPPFALNSIFSQCHTSTITQATRRGQHIKTQQASSGAFGSCQGSRSARNSEFSPPRGSRSGEETAGSQGPVRLYPAEKLRGRKVDSTHYQAGTTTECGEERLTGATPHHTAGEVFMWGFFSTEEFLITSDKARTTSKVPGPIPSVENRSWKDSQIRSTICVVVDPGSWIYEDNWRRGCRAA